MNPSSLRFVGTSAAVWFWIQWVLANAIAFGWGWLLARPTAIDIGAETHESLGVIVFVAVFLVVPLAIQVTLLVERLLLPAAPSGPFLIALSSCLGGGLVTVAVLCMLPIYFGLATLVSGFGLVVCTLGLVARASAQERDWLPTWRLVWTRGRWVLALTVFLVLFSTFAQPWLLKDKGRRSGNVPAAVLGAMIGSITGLGLARLSKKTAKAQAV